MDNDKLLDIRAQLEEELTWRQDEIRFLRNQLAYIENEDDRNRFRKALLVMLYSHYEGFCATAFKIYIKAINDAGLKRRDVNSHIAACSFHKEFRAYEDGSRKTKLYREVFGKRPPDDSHLYRFARQIDFIDCTDQFWDQFVHIPDNVIDTESNLGPDVLKKLLFRLGLPHEYFNNENDVIHNILNRRNNVAHGGEKLGVDEGTYGKMEKAVFHVFDCIVQLIMTALKKKGYLNQSQAVEQIAQQ